MKKTSFKIQFFLYVLFFTAEVFAQSGWIQQTSGTGYNLKSVFFVDTNTGYAVGDSTDSLFAHYHVILKTSDGGASWLKQSAPPPSNSVGLTSVFFLNRDTGYVCGGGASTSKALVMKTLNGGATWTNIYYNTTTSMITLFFVDAVTGFATGQSAGNCIFKTVNGGYNWTPYTPLPSLNGNLKDIYFSDNLFF